MLRNFDVHFAVDFVFQCSAYRRRKIIILQTIYSFDGVESERQIVVLCAPDKEAEEKNEKGL